MLLVYICEDDRTQREYIETCVKNYIMIEELNAKLILSTENPYEIIESLQGKTEGTKLYFIDVNLKTNMNGLELAAQIRDIDATGKIVFITTHSELSYMTFTYKIEAMDYIIKGNIGEMTGRIRDCIAVALKRHLNEDGGKQNLFRYKVGNTIRTVHYSDIFFFESSVTPHKIIMHLEDTYIEFYGIIKELGELGEEFCRCHKSFVVNKNNIKYLDKTNKQVVMNNGETCLVSIRGMRHLK
ncbi:MULTISPECIES: LytR/AlgR family response regulator transcription factor [Bacillus cereus group]|uniref:LytTR family DNA-binding domain-containing protein n=1 Tax=Bacillus paramobilis TaxID=2817477 RepID=A0ABZ2VL31_9BACI|nr:LytTR family DNA-binding domain-containing protein [Bacillus cereus]